jgi:nicotinate-nucleotide adenylyltransferase
MPLTRIALFGTSADPPTIAHQAILRWLADQFDLVVVWAADNPFKTNQTPLAHRQEMLRLLITELELPQVSLQSQLSDWRTLCSVERAQAIWPDAALTLVVGTDVIASMHHWYQIDQLLPLVHLLVVQRPDAAANPTDLEQLRQMGAQLTIGDFVGPPLSSTALRQHLTQAGLTPAVAAYIQKEELYPWHDSTNQPLPTPPLQPH